MVSECNEICPASYGIQFFLKKGYLWFTGMADGTHSAKLYRLW